MQHEVLFTALKIANRLKLIEPLEYMYRTALPPFRYKKLDSLTAEPPVAAEIDDSDWEEVASPGFFSDWETNFILRTTFAVPASVPDDAVVVIDLPLGELRTTPHPEALAYVDGIGYAGIDRNHHELRLTPPVRDGRTHHLALAGWTSVAPSRGSRPYMSECVMAVLSQPARDFIRVARVALTAANALPENDPVHGALLNTLDEAFKALDLREPLEGSQAFYESIPAAYRILRQGIEKAGIPLNVRIYAAGHAHIDVAWLWTLDHTKQKARRTFYSVLRNMEQFPDYSFTQSQPQLYDYIRQIDPRLFEGIRERVAQNRWEAIGGMWVEADCNITGPESLARQFLLGRAFFRRHFGEGADSPVLWLPDVFGYAWNLPQLVREAGMEYFFTIKIGWNNYNRLPYDSFWWQGLDGSRVLTFFGTTPDSPTTTIGTYNADTDPDKVLRTWTNFQQKELVDAPLLISYGHGDGGGGPDRAHLENLAEMKCFPSIPQVRSGKVGDFFRDLEESAGDRLPVWNGELYLECHRGTYTSQARNKRANRKSEFALHDAEFLAGLAASLDPSYNYPAENLRRAWELVCLNQFHDILPGSSINAVYAESQQQYAEVARRASEARESALACLAETTGGDLLVVNPTSFPRSDLAFWPGTLPEGKQLRLNGKTVITQPAENGTWLGLGTLEPYSLNALEIVDLHPAGENDRGETRTTPAVEPVGDPTATPGTLENECLRVEFNYAGDIISIYDKTNHREVLPEGQIANHIKAYEDRPIRWDAWDIDPTYDDKEWAPEPAESIRVLESGDLRASIEIKRRILNSRYTQVISLQRGSARLDFDTVIDWRERHILLKVAFPVDVLSPTATYEIQWGNVTRPTHHNTSWDWARFESAAQKWVDLSEGDYGASLLNDCKYGHDIQGNVIRLSLLRAPTHPDPEADQGEQRFTYSLLPHGGGWGKETIAQAYALNDPLIVYMPEKHAAVRESLGPQFQLDRDNLVIETVKPAEDRHGWIVRLYETQRCRGEGRLRVGGKVSCAWRANLIEENQSELVVEDNEVVFNYRPYQIITLRVATN